MNYREQLSNLLDDDDSIEAHYGYSRLALVFNDEDFVIKIPFTYSIDEDFCLSEEDMIKDKEEYGYKDNEFYYDEYDDAYYYLGKYTGLDEYSDYCDQEVDFYYQAKDEGLEEFFAEEWYLGSINGVPFYAQIKAVSFDDYDREDNQNSVFSTRKKEIEKASDTIKKLDKEYCYRTGLWFATVFALYGEEKFKSLMLFLDTWDIHDLHDGNLGFINDKPVIFDYTNV